MDNTRPSCMCMTQEYWYYTMRLSQYHVCCQFHKSLSVPWVFANTMSPYHESMSKQWVHVYTMSPCLYQKSYSIPWVHAYTMSLCQIHSSSSIPWGIQLSDIKKIQITRIKKYKFQDYRNTSGRFTEIQTKVIQKYKLLNWRYTPCRSAEIQMTFGWLLSYGCL